jgi:hypothetical protein
MSKMNATSTSLVWRGTWEDGKRLTIRLSEIEMMRFTPEDPHFNVDGTPILHTDGTQVKSDARWSMRLSSGYEHLNLSVEAGNSIHEVWMSHLEQAATSRR